MRHGDARIGGNADRRGHARQNLKGNPALQQEQCLFAAAPKDEGVAPLEPNDRLSLRRLVGEEHIDVLLAHRVLAGLFSNVDELGIRRRIGKNALVGEMIIDDDLRAFHTLHRAHGQKARIPGTRADKKNCSIHTLIPISFKISRPPISSSSSASATPICAACAGRPDARERQTRIPSTDAIIAST